MSRVSSGFGTKSVLSAVDKLGISHGAALRFVEIMQGVANQDTRLKARNVVMRYVRHAADPEVSVPI